MDGKQLQSQYKDHLSDFQNWDQRAHAQEYILYPKNMGYHLCIDETALSKGDLYTILINRDKRGRKGSIIAVIQGTKTDDIIAVLTKMPQELRNQVKEITLDMAGSMQKIAKTCFPRAMQVIDRFHVQKLVYEAVQELRITYRWQVIKEENKAMKAAKEKGEVYKAEELENGDTLRQLLARSRYLLFKSPDKWTKSQKIRAELLFKQFEDIKHVYYYSLELGKIFSTNYDKDVARAKLALWYNKIEEYGYDTFTTVANSIENHYERGSVVILGGLSLVNSLHAYTFASLKRKKLISTTPLNDALNALILALNASAAAFVLLFTKKFKILSWLSLKPWGIALKFLFLHHENILFPND